MNRSLGKTLARIGWAVGSHRRGGVCLFLTIRCFPYSAVQYGSGISFGYLHLGKLARIQDVSL